MRSREISLTQQFVLHHKTAANKCGNSIFPFYVTIHMYTHNRVTCVYGIFFSIPSPASTRATNKSDADSRNNGATVKFLMKTIFVRRRASLSFGTESAFPSYFLQLSWNQCRHSPEGEECNLHVNPGPHFNQTPLEVLTIPRYTSFSCGPTTAYCITKLIPFSQVGKKNPLFSGGVNFLLFSDVGLEILPLCV